MIIPIPGAFLKKDSFYRISKNEKRIFFICPFTGHDFICHLPYRPILLDNVKPSRRNGNRFSSITLKRIFFSAFTEKTLK